MSPVDDILRCALFRVFEPQSLIKKAAKAQKIEAKQARKVQPVAAAAPKPQPAKTVTSFSGFSLGFKKKKPLGLRKVGAFGASPLGDDDDDEDTEQPAAPPKKAFGWIPPSTN